MNIAPLSALIVSGLNKINKRFKINKIRTTISVILSILCIIINLVCFVKMSFFYKRFVFEMFILMAQIVENVFIFISSFWIKEVKLLFARDFLGIFCFSIVGFSIMKFHFKVNENPNLERISNIIHLLFVLSIVIFFILGNTSILQIYCEDFEENLAWNYISWNRLTLVCILVVFAWKLIKDADYFKKTVLNKKINQIKEGVFTIDDSDTPYREILSNQQYFKTQNKQLKFILFSYLIFNIMDFLWETTYLSSFYSVDVVCISETEYRFTTFQGSFLFLLKNILDLGPSLVLPYTFYYIPIGKHKNIKDDFKLDEYKESGNESQNSEFLLDFQNNNNNIIKS